MKPEEIICQAANGNPHAQAFLEAYARRAHWVDDLADGHASAKWTSDGESRTPAPFIVAEREEEWLLILAGNPFFIEHRSRLVPAMVLALSAWVDSPKFTAEQESVLKAHWHEVVWLVAWLTGGWQKMRELASASREFDIEEQAPEPLQPRETPDFPMGSFVRNGVRITRGAGIVSFRCDQCGNAVRGTPYTSSLDPLRCYCSESCAAGVRATEKVEEVKNGT